jgi:uncharacterized membrane protein
MILGAAAGAIGAGVRLERSAPGAVVDRMPGPRAFIAALPPESREEVRVKLVASWDESRQLRRAAADARRAAFAAASEEPFNRERVRAAFAELRAADQRALGIFHDNVIDAFAEMSPEERREALQALARAAPARRQGVGPEQGAGPDQGLEGGAALTPEERQARRERWRQERRERWRQRREQQQQQQP